MGEGSFTLRDSWTAAYGNKMDVMHAATLRRGILRAAGQFLLCWSRVLILVSVNSVVSVGAEECRHRKYKIGSTCKTSNMV